MALTERERNEELMMLNEKNNNKPHIQKHAFQFQMHMK